MRTTRKGIGLAIAGAAMLALSLVQAGSANATTPGRDGRIAFWDYMSGQIYAVNPDGTALVQLTHVAPGQTAADPSWSPDGRRVAFDSDVSGHVRLWIMAASGEHAHRVARDRRNAADFLPTYTPDGRRLVFSRCVGEACAIYSIRVDGTQRRAITNLHASVDDIHPSVSPDGRWIAFARSDFRGIISQVWVMRADGTDAHAVTPPSLEAFAPTWSPDGRLIAFSSNCCRLNSRVYVMRPNGTGIRALTATPFPNNDIQPAYAPQGDQIAFGSDRRYPDLCCVDLFRMRSNGTRQRLIHTGIKGVLNPSWGTAPLLSGTSSGASSASRATAATALRRGGVWCQALPEALRVEERCPSLLRASREAD